MVYITNVHKSLKCLNHNKAKWPQKLNSLLKANPELITERTVGLTIIQHSQSFYFSAIFYTLLLLIC